MNGVNCHVSTISPNMEQMWDIVEEQGIFDSEQWEMLEEIGFSPEEIFQDMDITLWYDDQSYLPVKEIMSATMNMPSEDNFFASDELELDMTVYMDIEINMYYRNLNNRVSIELPPEAYNAISM